MGGASAKKTDVQVDHDALDETISLPELEGILEASEPMLYETRQQPQEIEQALLHTQLGRLVELSESIDSRLGQIADLLTQQGQPGGSSGTSEKTSNKLEKQTSVKDQSRT